MWYHNHYECMSGANSENVRGTLLPSGRMNQPRLWLVCGECCNSCTCVTDHIIIVNLCAVY